MPEEPLRLTLISGSLRSRSTNTALLRTALELVPEGAEAVLYEGLAELPHFNPDEDPPGGTPPRPVAALRRRLAETDAILFCTPEYAGALPGSFKNLLDWTVGGGETYGMPVAWVNVSGRAATSGGADAHDSLRKVLGYTGSEIVEQACARIPLSREMVGPDGTIADAEVRERLGKAIEALLAAARGKRAEAAA
ncbi:MAG TPA: NAD(P)H-dependent oxidoreductase [Solirubrobacterales bacterium]